MPYDRVYTMQEVARVLYESELRPSPSSGQAGHALGLHGDIRQDVTDQRYKTVILLGSTVEETRGMNPADTFGTPIPPHKPEAKDGKILSRKDMIKAVTEAFNSPGGQAKLRELNGAETRVQIAMKLVTNAGKILASSVEHPMIKISKKKSAFATGPSVYREGFADSVVVIVDKMPPPNPGCDIHIQTAYAKF